jgi:hypothetical protein
MREEGFWALYSRRARHPDRVVQQLTRLAHHRHLQQRGDDGPSAGASVMHANWRRSFIRSYLALRRASRDASRDRCHKTWARAPKPRILTV